MLVTLFRASDGRQQSNWRCGSNLVVEFNVVTVGYKNISCTVNRQSLIFVVDPNDRDRVDAERGSAATHAELRHDALHGERGRELGLYGLRHLQRFI
uniref:Uncharacterized protein n=1 Tax=Hyaloperonospora arabidopsidis (strain Emoy2) TaxID=559515 RepID=M4BIV2_HYAAE